MITEANGGIETDRCPSVRPGGTEQMMRIICGSRIPGIGVSFDR